MKKIVAEFPLRFEEPKPASNVSLLRFPAINKAMAIGEIRHKPLSGYLEIFMPFPRRNVSALRQKQLDSDQIVYRGLPTAPLNYYQACLEDGVLVLKKIQKMYLMDPGHQYYHTSVKSNVLVRAESREELEHRKRSINFKLRCIENEESRVLLYEDVSMNYNNRLVPEAARPQSEIKAKETKIEEYFDHEQVESIFKKARIANLSDFVQMFGNEQTIKNIFFKMAVRLAGRFILKNEYYERELRENRKRLLELFSENDGKILISDCRFLKDEMWMAEEIAEQRGLYFVLKGYKEVTDFDVEAIERGNRLAIGAALAQQTMLSLRGISKRVGIDEDIAGRYLSCSDYHHLANNSYVLNDSSYWFNSILEAFTGRKSLSVSEGMEILVQNEIVTTEEEFVAELKKYCNCRGGKYYLKIIKE